MWFHIKFAFALGRHILLRSIIVGLLLFGVWLLLSGHYNILLLCFGLLSTLITLYLSSRLSIIDHEGHPVHLTWRILKYLPWLLGKIISSNIDVARRILSPKVSINPTHSWIDCQQTTDLGKVIYANSITLTPGTIAINIADNKIEIHALTSEAIADLQTGEMDFKVSGLIGDD
ncbi:Na(+) H(+) antiporter subunit E [hydrothermal vent metagenome]|uniref:Na(+) H(+) antiporter subunit E n=1 Tax=hydrothermal vent metagenome TaxID=652676 RepID=A0A3B0YFE6_9ZZZZ